jgi:hypothetical protein
MNKGDKKETGKRAGPVIVITRTSAYHIRPDYARLSPSRGSIPA